MTITAAEWSAPDADLLAFDRRIHAAEARGDVILVVRASHAERAAGRQIRLRYQRLEPKRNEASTGATFGAVLARHRGLYDLSRPLIRADFEHAIDTWQWVLRLDRHARLPVQIAALFHAIERVESEHDARTEPAYARRCADLMRATLADGDVDAAIVAEADRLITAHARAPKDADSVTLNDADALSFFALGSPGFVSRYGASHARRKIDEALAQMSPRALNRLLTGVRLTPLVRDFVSKTAGSLPVFVLRGP